VEQVLANAETMPGHLFEATAARIFVLLGRTADAAAELERILSRALASSGPRWLGAMTDLAIAAAAAGDTTAAAQIHEALAPYRGRLVIWGVPRAPGDRYRITSGCWQPHSGEPGTP